VQYPTEEEAREAIDEFIKREIKEGRKMKYYYLGNTG
jgi:hypothetical protein